MVLLCHLFTRSVQFGAIQFSFLLFKLSNGWS